MPEFPSLYEKFSALFTHNDPSFNAKPAVWHVPEPRKLRLYGGLPSLPKTFVKSTDHIQRFDDIGLLAITFGDLESASSKLASIIHHQLYKQISIHVNSGTDETELADVQAKSVVVILMPPGIARNITKIACIRLKLAYLPLDRQLSVGRIVEILNQVSPCMIVTSHDYHEAIFEKNATSGSHKPFIKGRVEHLRRVMKKPLVKVFEDLFEGNLDAENRLDAYTATFSRVQNPVVIVLSTSGSTLGGPKLVKLRNNQLLNRLQWQWDTRMSTDKSGSWSIPHARTGISTEVALSSTAVVFVDAFTELFGALFAGATVVVPGGTTCPSEMSVSDVRVLSHLINLFRITQITTVPNQLKSWMSQKDLMTSRDPTSKLESLQTVVVSGDILLPELARDFFRKCYRPDELRLINLYGTTELAGDVTGAVFHSIDDVNASIKHAIPHCPTEHVMEVVPFISVGKPIFNTTVYILQKITHHDIRISHNTEKNKQEIDDLAIIGPDRELNICGYDICRKGTVGEVAVKGFAVGFHTDNLAKNFSSTTNGLYFPGDLGFVCPEDQCLYICGRSDELVKINGVGVFANESDRIISRLKEECLNNPEQLSDTERKFFMIRESVTLPIQHPLRHECRLVCFYVIEPGCSNGATSETTAEPATCHRDTFSLTTNGATSSIPYPTPSELSKVMAYYLPVYIRPVFIRVHNLPIISSSGKIDKQRLRAAYRDLIVNDLKDEHLFLESDIDSTDRQSNSHASIDDQYHLDDRERARKVLAKVLGLMDCGGNGKNSKRPRDDEDFYFLGGNSLTAVLALENLRQLGFNARLETFYHAGNIGQILDSLTSHGTTMLERDLGEHMKRDNLYMNGSAFFDSETIIVREWEDDISPDEFHPSREDIVLLLVEEFGKRDPISHAFELKWTDLELAANTYLKSNAEGIVLTATYRRFDTSAKDKFVGVLLSLPSNKLPELPATPALSVLQRYFSFCAGVEVPEADRSLTVCMVGIRALNPEQDSVGLHTNRAKWNRFTLEILAKLERHLLEVARLKGYTRVETINTNEATKEVCSELGYTYLKSSTMEEFALKEKVLIDHQFYDHQCHFMVKQLGP